MQKTGKAIRAVMETAADMKIDPVKKKELMEKAKALETKLKALAEKVFPDRSRQGIFDRSASIGGNIFSLRRLVADSFEPLTQAAEVKYGKVKKLVDGFLKEYNTLFETEVADFKKLVKEADIGFFTPFEPLKTGK
jgi:uncharacterized protein (DUF111 family)